MYQDFSKYYVDKYEVLHIKIHRKYIWKKIKKQHISDYLINIVYKIYFKSFYKNGDTGQKVRPSEKSE